MKSIFETAKSGGEYSKHYERYKGEYLSRLRRAARSYEKVIAEHEEWIKNPAIKLKDRNDADYVRLYTEGKWPDDIARNRAYKIIIEGIIEERKHGKPD